MDDAVRRRFAALIEASGIEHKAASLRAGLGATYVGDVIRKKRGKLDHVIEIVDKIAPTYSEWVRTGRGQAPPATLTPEIADTELPFEGPVRILGEIRSAGVAHLRSPQDQETLQVFAPPGTAALENTDISLGVPFRGWLVLYREDQLPMRDELFDRLCVVKTQDERILVRWVKRGSTGGVQLVSGLGEVDTDMSLIWASEVISIQPR